MPIVSQAWVVKEKNWCCGFGEVEEVASRGVFELQLEGSRLCKWWTAAMPFTSDHIQAIPMLNKILTRE